MSTHFDFLPSFHNTHREALTDLLNSEYITPYLCKTLNRELIFFFYGYASYLSYYPGIEPSEISPSAFIVKTSQIEIETIYGADSGYSIKQKGKKEADILIGNTLNDLENYISDYWQSNGKYKNIDLPNPYLGTQFKFIDDYFKSLAVAIEPKFEYDNRVFRAELVSKAKFNINDAFLVLPDHDIDNVSRAEKLSSRGKFRFAVYSQPNYEQPYSRLTRLNLKIEQLLDAGKVYV